MKLAIVTRADKKIEHMSMLTHPYLKAYANKCGADFIVLDHTPPIMTQDGHPHYRIMKCYELLEEYDRLIQLDTDMLIRPDCPNLFEVVDKNKIGVLFEDKGSRQADRLRKIKRVQEVWGEVGWSSGYLNTGTFVVSKEHRDIFLPYKGKYWLEDGSDDIHFGYLIHKFGFKVQELSYLYNHMSMFSEPWNDSKSMYDSYIWHFAGPQNCKISKIEKALQELRKLKGA